MMKKMVRVLLLIVLTGTLWGCYPEGPDYYSDYDIVYTNFDKTYTFQGDVGKSYYISDKIIKITGNLTEGEQPEFVSAAYSVQMINRIKANMTELGYTLVTNVNNADLFLSTAALETTNISYYYDWWYSWYGWGWYYPYPITYSYKTGSLAMNLIDMNDVSADGKKHVIWTSIINGLLEGSSADFSSRMDKSIDQAFAQSQYLHQ
jgi:hypothetical protein